MSDGESNWTKAAPTAAAPLDVQLHPSGTITYQEPDRTQDAEDLGRAQLQIWFARLVMGEDRRRHELLAAIASLPDEGFRDFVAWAQSMVVGPVATAAEAWLTDEDRPGQLRDADADL